MSILDVDYLKMEVKMLAAMSEEKVRRNYNTMIGALGHIANRKIGSRDSMIAARTLETLEKTRVEPNREGDCDMAMSNDRVRFFLTERHFCFEGRKLVQSAFNMTKLEISKTIRENPDGFWIVCRPSQFARFLIYRNGSEVSNSFVELKPTLVPEKWEHELEVWRRPHQCYKDGH